MTATTAEEIKTLTQQMTDLALSGDRHVAIGAALTSAALVCVCHDMADDEIRHVFEIAIEEARAADKAAHKRGAH